MLVFDERSMISAEDMGMIETYAKQVVHQGMHKNSFFGNIPVILLVGDDYQLPPIMPGASANKANPKPSYRSAFVMEIVKNGLNSFNALGGKVVKLKTSKRSLINKNLLSKLLKGVRGDLTQGLSKENINKMMQFHLNFYHWSHDQVNKI